MGALSFRFSYLRDRSLVLSPEEVLATYFHGIPLKDRDGRDMPRPAIELSIRAAQDLVEKIFSVKLRKQAVVEDRTYYADDYYKWDWIKTTCPIVDARAVDGFYADQQQIAFPPSWLSVKKSNQGEFHRNLHIVPDGTAAVPITGIYVGTGMPYTSLISRAHHPNYWRVTYLTGWDVVPYDLLQLIGRLAAVDLFRVAGDIALGNPNQQNTSLSIDGLTQSIIKNGSYKERIAGYLSDIKEALPRLAAHYKGITFQSL